MHLPATRGEAKVLIKRKIYLRGSGLGATFPRAIVGSASLQIVGMALGFLVGVQLARGLAPAGYGVYSLVMSIAAIAGILTEFGLPQLLMREVSIASVHQNWAWMRGVMLFSSGTVAISSFMMALLAESLLSATHIVMDPELRATLRWAILLIQVASQTKLCGVAMQGIGRIVWGQLSHLVLRPGFFSFGLFLTAFATMGAGLKPSTAMGLQVAGAAGALFVAALLLSRFVPREALRTTAEFDTRVWLSNVWPMAITDGLHTMQGQLSVFMLGLLSTTSEIGLFRIADVSSSVCGFPASMLNIVAAPVIARLWASTRSCRN